SVLRTTSLWLSEGRQKMVNVLSGERSEAYDMHLFIGKKGDLVIDTTLRHIAKDTKGDVLIKGVVQDGAYAGLDGIVKIEKGASGAESFIAEHVLLLSPQARARARPRLEIENNDVSSRHAASVTPIDKDKAFYLMSRGISEKDSGRLIVEGFMLSAIERMPVEAKERIGARLASELSESL
ncbi:MAG: SufD family Fe-S cluster assembly protein, partial [Candidatus Micrarchaeota archaeon]